MATDHVDVVLNAADLYPKNSQGGQFYVTRILPQ